jgi:hypothetical protein
MRTASWLQQAMAGVMSGLLHTSDEAFNNLLEAHL